MKPEEKARDFLDYIGRHEERLKHNLAKNVSYDRELIENAFQDTVVRIHDAIMRNDPDITDYENYFFTASRKWYMTLHRRMERRRNGKVAVDVEDLGAKGNEDRPATVEDVKALVAAQFGPDVSELFIDYLYSKTRGRTNYVAYGREVGIPSLHVKEVVGYVRQHLRKRYPHGLTSEGARTETERIKAAKRVIMKIRERFGDGMDREEKTELP